MANVSLRDAEITGVYNVKEHQELLMDAQLQSGQKCQLVFRDVEWWELCSFGVENILSVINAYDENSLTKAIIDEEDIGDKYVKKVQNGPCKLFVLHASAGLSGWIISGNMVVKSDETSDSGHAHEVGWSDALFFA